MGFPPDDATLRTGHSNSTGDETMDTTDLLLAIAHHLLVFSLAGIIGAVMGAMKK